MTFRITTLRLSSTKKPPSCSSSMVSGATFSAETRATFSSASLPPFEPRLARVVMVRSLVPSTLTMKRSRLRRSLRAKMAAEVCRSPQMGNPHCSMMK